MKTNHYILKKDEEFESAPQSLEDCAPAIIQTNYKILEGKKVVGEIQTNNYFGWIQGTLHGKTLPNISNYLGLEMGVTLEDRLEAFRISKTGQKMLNRPAPEKEFGS